MSSKDKTTSLVEDIPSIFNNKNSKETFIKKGKSIDLS